MANENSKKTQRTRSQAKQEIARAGNLDLPESDAEVPPEAASLDELVKELAALRVRYTKALQQVERSRSEVERMSTSLEQEKGEWELKASSLAEREEKLAERLEAVTALELDAETGFADKQYMLYEEFRSKTDAIREELSVAAAAIAKADTESLLERLGELRTVREELEHSFAQRTNEVVAREDEVDRERRELTVERRKVDADRRQLEWDRENAETRNALAQSTERASHETERQIWEAERQSLEEALQRVAEHKADLERRQREYNFVDPLQLEADRDSLRAELRARDEELARRPPQSEFDEMLRRQRDLESQLVAMNELLDRNQRLATQLEGLRAELAQMQLVETKNENLRQEKASLVSEVDELRKVLGELSERRGEGEPFQLCRAIDQDNHLQASADLWVPQGGLRGLVDHLMETMASKNLYYDKVTIRSFLAGMNSSRLHILQGISGTGKSSLPQAVADALGVPCPVVEVQAAWRDRQDLLGYFNPFEHRFEETPFTVALYRAQTPLHRNSPFFVVLDEMNLSHPEQYLADVLSAMERPEGERALRLMNHATPQAPAGLWDGMLLPLPPNVWMIGTANHDETTVSFAPKTYDRSHVFELPTEHPPATAGRPRGETQPVSLRTLRNLFAAAVVDNRLGAATCAKDFVKKLRPQLASMNVGWGNRIEIQLEQYAPVVTGANGTVCEAVDVFVSHKILTKLEGRYDFRPTDLRSLRDEVLQLWPDLPGDEQPERILALLDREEARLS